MEVRSWRGHMVQGVGEKYDHSVEGLGKGEAYDKTWIGLE